MIVGLPRHLRGGEEESPLGAQVCAPPQKAMRTFASQWWIERDIERAHARLRASGIPEYEHRSVIDQVAAQINQQTDARLERMTVARQAERIITRDQRRARIGRYAPNIPSVRAAKFGGGVPMLRTAFGSIRPRSARGGRGPAQASSTYVGAWQRERASGLV